jgi:hypothetical protein
VSNDDEEKMKSDVKLTAFRHLSASVNFYTSMAADENV